MEKLRKSILVVAVVVTLILMVPLVAMQFTTDVDWGVADFIIMGGLLFGTGLTFVLVTQLSTNFVYRAAVALALGSTLFMIWANLAVGLIGSGPHPGNMMYLGVVAIVVIGMMISRFKPAGMELAMYGTALAFVVAAAVALLANMDEYPGSSVTEIIGVNGFFSILFAISGTLFRHVAKGLPEKSAG